MLWEDLMAYSRSGMCPMHMPGHKRRGEGAFSWYEMDITEIDGFDNLHRAEGVLKEGMELAARVVGSRRSWFLVNGSTCGLLAAVYAALHAGEEVLVARNSHISVYHALCLRGARVTWLYPDVSPLGYALGIRAQQVEEAFAKQPSLKACVLTSPTYEGIVSEVDEIARICHRYGAALIVDEAHGAHLPLDASGAFPRSSIAAGADVVVQSLHKTLPSPTQTALLSLNGGLVSERRLAQALSIFETSSPSYPLMAGIDRCMHWAFDEGHEAMARYGALLHSFYQNANRLRCLGLASGAAFGGTREQFLAAAAARDPGKLLVFAKNKFMTGKQLYDILKDRFQIQPEMAAPGYVLLMTSPMDDAAVYERLLAALYALDAELAAQMADVPPEGNDSTAGEVPGTSGPVMGVALEGNDLTAGDVPEVSGVPPEATVPFVRPVRVLAMEEAVDLPSVEVPVHALTGEEISAEWVMPYPPGIPVLVPGEQVKEALGWLREHETSLQIVDGRQATTTK